MEVLLIHNAVRIYGNYSLKVGCVMLSNSPAAVALGPLHLFSLFLAFSSFLHVSHSPGMWHQCTTQLVAKSSFFIHHLPGVFEKWLRPRMFFMSACLALPLSNVVCFLFSQSLREHFSRLECLYQLFIWRNASFHFLLLQQMLCQGRVLVQGWVTCQWVRSFTCCVDKSCLSMQTNYVRGEQRRVYIWFLQDLSPDPNLKTSP